MAFDITQDKLKHFDYFERLADIRISQRRKYRYYLGEISSYIGYFTHQDCTALEIGCGTGQLLHDIKASRKVGIDYSPKMIEKAKTQFPDIEFHIMEAEALHFADKFDIIIISNLIGYLSDVQQVFEQLKKVCHERTHIIVNYHNFLWEPLLNLSEKLGLKYRIPYLNWFTVQDVNNLLYLSGFDVYRNTKRMLVPVNIPVISFIFNKYIAKLPIFRSFCLNFYTFARPENRISEGEYKKKYSTSVVIPARNESGNIENAILRIPEFGKHTEIIFVEGNSTDDTWEVIQKIAEKYKDTHDIKIARQDGKGKGDAVRKGFGMATGDILMILDADLTVPPEDLPKFYDAIASGRGEFINGSRLVYSMEKNAMRFLNLLGNKFFSWAFTWLLERPFKDTLCGTKVIFKDDYTRLIENRTFFGDFDPFGDFDLIFGAYKLNLKIVEMPIRYRERTYGDTNISRFKHGWILLKMCFFAARKIKFY